jgi:hypothetical protein
MGSYSAFSCLPLFVAVEAAVLEVIFDVALRAASKITLFNGL